MLRARDWYSRWQKASKGTGNTRQHMATLGNTLGMRNPRRKSSCCLTRYMRTEIGFETLGDVEAGALVNTMAETVEEVEAETLGVILGDVNAETLAKVKAGTFGKTLGDLDPEELLDKLADTLAGIEAETVGDNLDDVKSEALLEALPDTLPVVKTETVGDTLGDVKAEQLAE